jgi:hypothetical protein
MAKKNIMDALAGLSDPSDSEADASDEPEQEVPPKKQKRVTLEDLEATGYTTQNTVLFMKAPAEQQQLNTQWWVGAGRSGRMGCDPPRCSQRLRTRLTPHGDATDCTQCFQSVGTFTQACFITRHGPALPAWRQPSPVGGSPGCPPAGAMAKPRKQWRQ